MATNSPNPEVDLDLDGFSPFRETYRGANWKGKDCSDNNSFIYPGRYDRSLGDVDQNCNGIKGTITDDLIQKSKEEKYCLHSKPKGTVIFGDSMGAGFQIPVQLMVEADLNSKLSNLMDSNKDRYDNPEKSWVTGFDPEIKEKSIYMYMQKNNLCNHNDYQNLSVNNASSKDFLKQVYTLSRKPNDVPILGFVAFVGNDICHNQLSQMTNSTQFRQNIVEGLDALDQIVPKGSSIVLIGIPNGEFMWQTMHNRLHPLGITYDRFYSYLSSVGANPCRTWLTSRAPMRQNATKRAMELNQVLQNISQHMTWDNFDLIYVPFPLDEIIVKWKGLGKHPAKLISKADGFHPSLAAHRMLAKVIWQKLSKDYPDFVGPENEYNKEIEKWKKK